jgi:hypothetical protein
MCTYIYKDSEAPPYAPVAAGISNRWSENNLEQKLETERLFGMYVYEQI